MTDVSLNPITDTEAVEWLRENYSGNYELFVDPVALFEDYRIPALRHPSAPDTGLVEKLEASEGFVDEADRHHAIAIVRDFEKGAACANGPAVSESAADSDSREGSVGAAPANASDASAHIVASASSADLFKELGMGQEEAESAERGLNAVLRRGAIRAANLPTEPDANLVQAIHNAMYPCTGWEIISGATQQKIKKAAVAATNHFSCEITVINEEALMTDMLRAYLDQTGQVPKSGGLGAVLRVIRPHLRNVITGGNHGN